MIERFDLASVRSWSWANPKKGHDSMLVSSNMIGVADGATPLDPDWPQDVRRFADRVLLLLDSSWSQGSSTGDPRDALRETIATVAEEFNVIEPQLSCTLAVCVLVGGDLVALTSGDCFIAVRSTTGPIDVLSDDSLERLDQVAYSVSDPVERRKKLIANRRLLNQDPGYWAISANPLAADRSVVRRFESARVRDVLIGTDGFSRFVDRMFDSMDDAIESISQNRAPRFELSEQAPIGPDATPDDATGIYWKADR